MKRTLELLALSIALTAAAGCATHDEAESWAFGEEHAALEVAAEDARRAPTDEAASGGDEGGEVQEAVVHTGGPWDEETIDVGVDQVTICIDFDCWTGGYTGPGTSGDSGSSGDGGNDGNGGTSGGSSGDGNGNGNGSTNDSGVRRIVKVFPPQDMANRRIVHADHVTDCFETVANDAMTHTVTIYVDQPTADSSDRFHEGNQDFGHAWIGIEQQQGQNTVVRRMIGMRPNQELWASNGTAFGPAHLRDEPAQRYDVAVSFPVTAADFRSLMAVFSSAATTDAVTGHYHIEHNNSVDFVHALMSHAGYTVPRTEPSTGAFRGPDNGRFGQDLQAMTIHPNMTLSTNGWSPASNANCPGVVGPGAGNHFPGRN